MHIWQDLMMIWDRKGAAEAFENHGANAKCISELIQNRSLAPCKKKLCEANATSLLICQTGTIIREEFTV